MEAVNKVIIRETAPRDGWQNLEFIETDMKFQIIEKIVDMGAPEIEVTSFVNPKAVPQTRDASELARRVIGMVSEKDKHVKLTALVPNKKGAENAYASGIKTVDFVMSASEEHNKRNVRRTIDESFAALEDIIDNSPEDFEVRLAFACVFGSPFGDKIDIDNVIKIIEKSLHMGVKIIGLADSAGLSTPDHTSAVLRRIKEYVDIDKLSAHIHDTRGLGIANTYAAYQEGIYKFDAALGGLGGCPFIPGAAGNISSEDVITMFERMGVKTGIDMGEMKEASLFLSENIKGKYNSKILDINKINS
ncbi:hydroxymethylglutaryl-CoA lyase [Sedimentibacter hydroxybenzoicus DSM 7310]|uniref:Hydroxymethylglutaryl-CoA lyase n=1 Tax=Sedimentibacter hydroxybenzoicus DSM 7310 TaxID=1123245 RepID=A0A974BIN7_SEDHY|nr:hydroxymethylglutaryl-CoA lyase [Sedimentibacter hydroxybenzoicus]NYB73827.1 hydroxymethylglutaryl-CoA lyase [Sedimentibacter hydroxybenzoicus DSM 7310]